MADQPSPEESAPTPSPPAAPAPEAAPPSDSSAQALRGGFTLLRGRLTVRDTDSPAPALEAPNTQRRDDGADTSASKPREPAATPSLPPAATPGVPCLSVTLRQPALGTSPFVGNNPSPFLTFADKLTPLQASVLSGASRCQQISLLPPSPSEAGPLPSPAVPPPVSASAQMPAPPLPGAASADGGAPAAGPNAGSSSAPGGSQQKWLDGPDDVPWAGPKPDGARGPPPGREGDLGGSGAAKAMAASTKRKPPKAARRYQTPQALFGDSPMPEGFEGATTSTLAPRLPAAQPAGSDKLAPPGPLLPPAGNAPAPSRAKSRERSKAGQKRPRCTCKNSKCIKMYCDCFAAGEFCLPGECGCVNCANKARRATRPPRTHRAHACTEIARAATWH